jgi:chromosome partitioning protein
MAADLDFPILKTEIEQRVAYAESLTMGRTIFEWAPESPACDEIEKLSREIRQLNEEELLHSPPAKTQSHA